MKHIAHLERHPRPGDWQYERAGAGDGAGARARGRSRGRDQPRSGAGADHCGGAGCQALGVGLDVRDESSVSAAIDSAYELLGGLDVLVNNAGIGMLTVNPGFMTEPSLWDVPPAGFRDVLATKATGTFLVARAVVPQMSTPGTEASSRSR